MSQQTKESFKIVLFGNTIYHEIELKDKFSEGVVVGTTKNSKIRFNREAFFNDFELSFVKSNAKWLLECNESVYIVSEGILKRNAVILEHGNEIILKYHNNDTELFKICFLINFDDRVAEYDRVIDLNHVDTITIGGQSECDIYIEDDFVGQDYIQLSKNNKGYFVNNSSTKYGVYVDGFKIEKDSKQINDYDFFMFDGYSFYIKENKLYTSVSDNITVKNLTYTDYEGQENQFKYPKFVRNVRIKSIVPNDRIEVLAPKSKPEKPKSNLFMSLLPSVAALAIIVGLRGLLGGGGMFILYSGAMMSVGILTSVLTYINSGREYKKSMQRRREEYFKYIVEKENEIRAAREKEINILKEKYIDMDQVIQEALEFNAHIFEKYKTDDDFLKLRLGTGTIKSHQQIDYKKQEFKDVEDELQEYPEKLAKGYEYIENAPVVLDFKATNSVGIVGDREGLYEILKLMTIEIVVRHFYEDVKLYYIFNEKDYSRFEWKKWLRNVRNENTSVRNFMYDEESQKIILEYLYNELSRREGLKKEEVDLLPHMVLFIYDSAGFLKHPVSKYIDRCNKVGFTFVFFEESKEFLPIGCNIVVRLEGENQEGTIINSENAEEHQQFVYTTVENEAAAAISLRLGCVYVDDVNLESNLTKNINLYELLDIFNADELNLKQRWNNSKVWETMAAPLGVKSDGDIVSLDLHEKFHGPHGLVAGTTGSGKSEIMQSYILSVATLFHPYDVAFVIIDFKGGGMVNQFRSLPHLAGAITNIDGREIERSLQSIRAELQKRQELFAEQKVNHIDAYIKKFKIGEATIPLPHLILLVDEFAELKSEQPEFMKELISAARIGRSLGVHLILATQKPAGVVNDQIWSNSKFKLCLKVQDKNDSNEVIKSPLAAEIKEPGRAYLQVGNNEIFQLFQSAYSGAPALSGTADNKKEYEICQINLVGQRKEVFSQKNKQGEQALSQLEALVTYISDYCKNNMSLHLPPIFLPPLKEVIPYECVEQEDEVQMTAAIGYYDDPSHQYQGHTSINITEENTFIIGSSQSGKTNLLQVIIKDLAQNYLPNEVNFYILDFASMILKNFESLNHVGGVITSSEDEKLKNFFKMIHGEMADRKEQLAKTGVTSFGAYKEAGYTDLPQIVIMVDNLTALKELYLNEGDWLIGICRDGLALGISVIVANSQTTGVGYKYLANFSKRIALFCNDSADYGTLFEHCRMQINSIAGRCILELDKELFEGQIFLAFEGEREIDRVNELKKFIDTINEEDSEYEARRIPEIPELLTDEYMNRYYKKQIYNDYKIAVGLDYDNVNPLQINLKEMNALAITGRSSAGKTNFVKYLLHTMNENRQSQPAEVYIVDSIAKKLLAYRDSEITKDYTINCEMVQGIIKDFASRLEKRYSRLAEEENYNLEKEPLLVMVVLNPDALSVIANNRECLEAYKQILTRYKLLKVTFIYSNVENAAIPFNAPEPLKMLKESRHFMIFDDISEQKIVEVPIQAARAYKKAIEPGDGYYVRGTNIVKVKTILNTSELR